MNINGSVVLMYVMDGQMYPIAMTEDQFNMLQVLARTFEPIQVINQPQGKVTNLTGGKKDA